MDSGFNYRHTEVHVAELHRRAELHRQVARARRPRQSARSTRPSLLAPPSLIEAVQVTFARLTHARHTPAIGSKAPRA
jgi:hypothetical protein